MEQQTFFHGREQPRYLFGRQTLFLSEVQVSSQHQAWQPLALCLLQQERGYS